MDAGAESVTAPDVASERATRARLGVGLLAVLAATRLPLYEPHFFNWDNAQLGLGLTDFDVAWHQPHPPGYVLYIALGRAFAAVFGTSPELTLELLATLMSGLGIFGVFVLASRFRRGAAPWLAAASAVFNPVVWAYGVIGESYAAEFAACTWLGVLAVDAWRGAPRAMWLLGLCLGLLGGIRTSVTLFMGPLVALALWRCPRPKPHRLAAAALTGVGVAAWLVPTVWLVGGLDHYLFLTRQLTMEVIAKTVSPLFAITPLGPENILLTVLATVFGLGLVPILGAVALALASGGRPGERRPASTPPFWLVAVVWTAPAMLFYAAMFMSKPGYVLTYAAPFFVLSGHLLDSAARHLAARAPALKRVASFGAFSLALVPNAALFASDLRVGGVSMATISLSSIATAEVALALALEVPAVEEARLGARVAVISNNGVLDWRRLTRYDPAHLELELVTRDNVPALGDRIEVFAGLGGKTALGSGSPGFWAMPFSDYPRALDVALGPVGALVGFVPERTVSATAEALGPAERARVAMRRHKGLPYVVIDLRGLKSLTIGPFRLMVGGEPLTFARREPAP